MRRPADGANPAAAVNAAAHGPTARLSTAADLPGWDGAARGEPGIHGVPRARRWDAVVTAIAPSVRGDVVHFVAVDDERLVVDEDEPEAAVAPLAAAASATVQPPYRAEAVRQQGERWVVAVSRISVAHVPALAGEEAELVASKDGLSFHIDGRPRFDAVPALERAGERQGREYVVRASRLAGDLWEVEATAL